MKSASIFSQLQIGKNVPPTGSHGFRILVLPVGLVAMAVWLLSGGSALAVNPLDPALGFNAFLSGNLTLNGIHSEGPVAMGGNFIWGDGTQVAMNKLTSSGYTGNPYKPPGSSDTLPTLLVVGGQLSFSGSSGNVVINSIGNAKVGSLSGVYLHVINGSQTYVNQSSSDMNPTPRLSINAAQTSASLSEANGINFTTAFSTMAGYSATIATLTASSTVDVRTGSSLGLDSSVQNFSMNLVPNKINVVNLTGTQINNIQNGNWNNQPSATQPVIFNINTGSGAFYWYGRGFQSLSDNAARYVLFNFYTANGSTITIDGNQIVAGAIYAPLANVVKNGNVNVTAQIVAKSYTHNGGELHAQAFLADLPLSPATFSLGNRVFADNGAGVGGVANDSIQNGSEPGIANVVIKLFAGDASGNPTGSALQSTNTDANGYYRFDGLVAGKYVPVVDVTGSGSALASFVSSTGYSTDTTLAGDLHDHGIDTPLGVGSVLNNGIVGAAVTLGAGLQPTGEATGTLAGANGPSGDAGDNLTDDFGFSPVGAVGDSVWVDANGNGIQDVGELGLAGVTVILYRTNSGLGTLTALATTTTSASGAYLFTNVLPNNYVVSFGTVSGYTRTIPFQGSNSNLDSNAQVGSGLSEVFTLTSGQTNLTVDAGYYQPANLSGTVVLDVNGNGLQDVGETNGLTGVSIALKTNGATMLTTTTDSSGNYSFANLAPGSYTVVQTTPTGCTNTTALTLPMTLTSGQSSPGHHYLDTQPVTIGDYVWVDANGNGIQDNGEAGLGGVQVILYQTNSGLGTLTALATNTTLITGAYLFTNQLPNSFVVGFGAASGYTRTIPFQGSNSNLDSNAQVGSGLSEVFTLTSGQTNLTVDAGYYQPANLSGTVVLDVNGNGVQDVGETTGLSGVSIVLKTNGVTMLTTTTDSSGNYSFANLAPGSYTVVQTTPTGYINTTPLTLPVTLTSGQSSPGHNYLDTQSVTIGDYVWVDANANGIQDNGEAGLAGVSVVLYQTNSGLGTLTALVTNTTSASGAYQFANQLPNSFVVGFGDVAGYTRTTPFQGGDTNLDSNAQVGSGLSEVFTLTSGQTNLTVDAGYYQPVAIGDYTWLDINGNGIQDPGEPPMAGVAITLFQSNVVTHVVSTVASTISGAGGAYLFTNLPPGTYQLGFTPPGGGYTHSPALQGSNTNLDSDANATTGLTPFYTMASGMTNLTLDAGFKPNPTAVSLVSLSARQDKGQVWVTWQTYVEDGVLAFDLTRSTDGGEEQEVTPDLVWATGLDMGQTYRVQDAGVPAKTSTYHLYAYNNDGSVDEVATVNIAVANTVVGTPVQMLGIDLQGASAVLRWTGGQPPYVVEQAGSLGAAANWQPVGEAQTGTQMAVPLSGPAGFFRVRSGGN